MNVSWFSRLIQRSRIRTGRTRLKRKTKTVMKGMARRSGKRVFSFSAPRASGLSGRAQPPQVAKRERRVAQLCETRWHAGGRLAERQRVLKLEEPQLCTCLEERQAEQVWRSGRSSAHHDSPNGSPRLTPAVRSAAGGYTVRDADTCRSGPLRTPGRHPFSANQRQLLGLSSTMGWLSAFSGETAPLSGQLFLKPPPAPIPYVEG